MIFISNSYEETLCFAQNIAKKTPRGSIIALTGDIGSGKTAFCCGFLQGCKYHGRVTSPTFSIVNEYFTPCGTILHFDMYRILDYESLYEIGFDDYLASDATLLIEWSENIYHALPENIIKIDIKSLEDTRRNITIEGLDI